MIDKKRFFFLPIIEKEKDSIFITDKNNYAIGKSNVTWIWTKEDISKEKIEEILKILEDIIGTEPITITCCKKLLDEIKQIWNITNEKKIKYLECNELKDIKHSPGFMDKPKYSDKTTLAKWWQEYSQELSSQELSFIDSLNEIDNWLSGENFYVWRENNGKIVCMANYWENNKIAKISYVYTPKDQRNKGYCKSLIYELTKFLIDKKIEPMLYTEYENISANQAYQSIGYENKEVLIRFKITTLKRPK